MALLWFDGFETYDDYLDANAVSGPGIGTVESRSDCLFGTTYGRLGGRGMRVTSSNSGSQHKIGLSGAKSTIIVGAAIRKAVDAVPTYKATAFNLIRFSNSTYANVYGAMFGSEINFYNYSGSLFGATVGAGLTYNTWRYMEFKVLIHASAGSIQVLSNGIEVLNLTGLDTWYLAEVGTSAVGLGAAYTGGVPYIHCDWDDLYICDTEGAQRNDFLGDVRVDALRPNGAGTYAQFTPSAGANYENVDEADGPDDDTTYNEGTTIGHKDAYAIESLPSPAGTTILGVKPQVTVKKTDAGARGIKVLTKAGSTENLSAEAGLAENYVHVTDMLEDNPDDSAAWEDADIASMEVGLEITS